MLDLKKSLYLKNKLSFETFFAEHLNASGHHLKDTTKNNVLKIFSNIISLLVFGKKCIYFTQSSKAVLSFYSLETVENLQLFTSKALYKESTQKA